MSPLLRRPGGGDWAWRRGRGGVRRLRAGQRVHRAVLRPGEDSSSSSSSRLRLINLPYHSRATTMSSVTPCQSDPRKTPASPSTTTAAWQMQTRRTTRRVHPPRPAHRKSPRHDGRKARRCLSESWRWKRRRHRMNPPISKQSTLPVRARVLRKAPGSSSSSSHSTTSPIAPRAAETRHHEPWISHLLTSSPNH